MSLAVHVKTSPINSIWPSYITHCRDCVCVCFIHCMLYDDERKKQKPSAFFFFSAPKNWHPTKKCTTAPTISKYNKHELKSTSKSTHKSVASVILNEQKSNSKEKKFRTIFGTSEIQITGIYLVLSVSFFGGRNWHAYICVYRRL